MSQKISTFFTFIVNDCKRRPDTVTVEGWGHLRTFVAFDDQDDNTIIFEDGRWSKIENRTPVIMVRKADLFPLLPPNERPFGYIMVVCSGNHAVASMPLVSGKFWDFADVPPEMRGDVITSNVLCMNIVDDTFEVSPREVPVNIIAEFDTALQGAGLPMSSIVIADRSDAVVEMYRRRGMEWRIKPLVWTLPEMSAAIKASRCHIHNQCVTYYHNVKGVHFLSYANFCAVGALARTRPDAVRKALTEWVGISRDDRFSFMTRPKYATHHEIQAFGVMPGSAKAELVPQIEALNTDAPRLDGDALSARFAELEETFARLLISADMKDESNEIFIETLYRNLTGDVYQDEAGLGTPAFDDRRTALPGASFLMGKPMMHPGADPRTEAIIDYVQGTIGHGDEIEYINIYEIRSETEQVRVGDGKSREIVLKTAWNPAQTRLIEKRLAQGSTGYGAYTMARVNAFRALGIPYGPHFMLARKDGFTGKVHYFVRERYQGEASDRLSASRYTTKRTSASGALVPVAGNREDPDVVLGVMRLLGEAAACNMILKKMKPESEANRHGEGKEILEFKFDSVKGKEMPFKVWLCSIRGTMGWPCWDMTEENLRHVFRVYLRIFADSVVKFVAERTSVTLDACAKCFMQGFVSKTREVAWNYESQRERFDSFVPPLYDDFHFAERWRFVLWSLERQVASLPEIEPLFYDLLKSNRDEDNQ